MKSPSRRKATKGSKKPEVKDMFTYLNDSVKNYAFADFVAVKSGPRGTLLSFGKGHPHEEQLIVFKEILLPLDVALRLKVILDDQFKELVEKGYVQIEPLPEVEKKK